MQQYEIIIERSLKTCHSSLMKLYEQHLPSYYDSKKEASIKLLNGIWQLDTRVIPNRTFCRFIYFFPDECRFRVVDQQLYKYVIMRVSIFEEVDKNRAIDIVSSKYPFAQILVGIYVKRRLISHTTFIHIVKSHPDWFGW
jgi:hypothetical protein